MNFEIEEYTFVDFLSNNWYLLKLGATVQATGTPRFFKKIMKRKRFMLKVP